MGTPKVGLNKIKRKTGFVYQIDYKINGKRKREIVGSSKKEAELVRSKIQTDFLYDRFEIPSEKKATTLDQLIQEFLQIKSNRARESSLTRYREYFHQFKYFLTKYFPATINDVSSIKTSYILESINHLTTEGTDKGRIWTPATSNSYRTQLASLFKYAKSKKYVKENPVSDIPLKEIEDDIKIKYYKPEEVEVILKNSDEKWARFYKFILQTGLRLGEIINLLWENVDSELENPKIFIKSTKDWKTKTGKGRIIPLNKTALEIINKQLNNGSDYVFPDVDGDKFEKHKPLRELKKILSKLGMEGDLHQFRHTFGTVYVSSKAGTLFDLSKIMGHSNTKTTEIYVHLSDEYLRETLSKIG